MQGGTGPTSVRLTCTGGAGVGGPVADVTLEGNGERTPAASLTSSLTGCYDSLAFFFYCFLIL